MSATTFNMSLDSSLRESADRFFDSIGMSTQDAVRMFLRQSVKYQKLMLLTEPPNTEFSLSESEKHHIIDMVLNQLPSEISPMMQKALEARKAVKISGKAFGA